MSGGLRPALPAQLPIEEIAPGFILYRAHTPPWSALYFGPREGAPPTHRFHSPDGTFRTCFVGTSDEAAFAEGVIHGPVPTGIVSAATLRRRSIAEVHVVEAIRAVPLYGRHMIRLGADASVTHGGDYTLSQQWGAAIHAHPQEVDGVLYSSRHDETTYSLALFDRAASRVRAGESRQLSDTDLRTLELLARYGLGLDA